ncbi:MAG: hypothetical protein V4597_08575 [Pseudomonadota bacterium]
MSVEWEGLSELLAALRSLPADLAVEAGHIVEASVNAAGVAVRAGYVGTGVPALADKVTTSLERTQYGAVGIVRSGSPWAWIFEIGAQARHTALGANRGTIPPGHLFVPAVMRERRRMYDELKAMMERHGLEVSGDA